MNEVLDRLTYQNVMALGIQLAERIPFLANDAKDYKTWTRAVYDALIEVQQPRRWHIFPKDRCYAGEYLCDFMLIQEGYGCRLACESQWQHWAADHQAQLDWAFDKLRGVKSDIKLFVFEGSADQWQLVQDRYLQSFAQLSTGEIYLSLRWEKTHFVRSIWQPAKDGIQEQVVFEQF